jgi:rhodanese-related sulfurtransferase
MDSSLRKSASFNGMRALHKTMVVFGFLIFSLPLMAASGYLTQKVLSCAAPKEYQKDLAQFSNTIKVDQDFSCLTDLPSIKAKLPQYQLVDIRSNATLDDAWKILVNDLRLKSYLHDRKLLLLGNNFSRVEAAAYCAILKKNGFTQSKILVGGAQLWQQYKYSYKPDHDARRVTAKDFMYEYFNGSVLVVAANKNIYQRLMLLGVEKIALFQSNEALSDLIINKSSGGYLPVVLVNDLEQSNSLVNRYSNLFVLNGGITALENQFKIDVMTDASRFDTLEVSACANRNL